MTDHAGFGWMLLILGLVIAGVGLVWILAMKVQTAERGCWG